MACARLERTIISLCGKDANTYLDRLITNSLQAELVFAALLTPQGKILADFFIHKNSDELLLETPKKFGADLLKRLKIYRLRADVILEDVSDTYNVYVFWGKDNGGIDDPRLSELGQRIISKEKINTTSTPEDYDLFRMSLGVPDSGWDFESAETFPHNVNMDLLGGIDFKKGCFIGQEVVSRMQRKTEIRKRMRAVKLSGQAKAGDLLLQAGRNVGELKHVNNDLAMAMIRLDRIENNKDDILVNNHKVKILEPNYV